MAQALQNAFRALMASTGLQWLLREACCQQAICRPSRASLMTGARPYTAGLFNNHVSLRELQPDIVTLPQHIIAHGYEAVYFGKIFQVDGVEIYCRCEWDCRQASGAASARRVSTTSGIPTVSRGFVLSPAPGRQALGSRVAETGFLEETRFLTFALLPLTVPSTSFKTSFVTNSATSEERFRGSGKLAACRYE